MKGYKNYMDSIIVEPSLHKKIMDRTTQNAAPQNKMKHVYRYAGLAACMAALLFGVWAMPNLFNSPAPSESNGLTASAPEYPQSEGQNGHIVREPDPTQTGSETADDPHDPVRPPLVLHALTFNQTQSVMTGSMLIPDGYFDYDLTDEQFDAIFPNLGLTLSAAVQYRNDGKVWFVTAS